jgi:hypothetical protein
VDDSHETIAFGVLLAAVDELHRQLDALYDNIVEPDETTAAAHRLAQLAIGYLAHRVDHSLLANRHVTPENIRFALKMVRGGNATRKGPDGERGDDVGVRRKEVADVLQNSAGYQVLHHLGLEGRRKHLDWGRYELRLIDRKFARLSHEQFLRVVSDYQRASASTRPSERLSALVDAVTELCRLAGNALDVGNDRRGREKVADALMRDPDEQP